MRQREWAFPPCENILTENVDIINGLCKEVEKLMHLLRGVRSVELEPFALLVHRGTGLWVAARTHKLTPGFSPQTVL